MIMSFCVGKLNMVHIQAGTGRNVLLITSFYLALLIARFWNACSEVGTLIQRLLRFVPELYSGCTCLLTDLTVLRWTAVKKLKMWRESLELLEKKSTFGGHLSLCGDYLDPLKLYSASQKPLNLQFFFVTTTNCNVDWGIHVIDSGNCYMNATADKPNILYPCPHT